MRASFCLWLRQPQWSGEVGVVHGGGDSENDDIDDHGVDSVDHGVDDHDHGDDDFDKKAWWRFRCLVIWRLGPEKMRGRQPPIMSHPTQNDGDNLHFDDDHAVRDDGGAVDEDGGDV